MFDQTINETTHWADDIRRGDIVLFRFPIRRAGKGEVPKVRPCLVLEVEDRFGEKRLTLAYGTSAPTAANRGYEIPVTHAEDVRAAGLRRATRFVGGRLLSVSPDHPGFRTNSTIAAPVIGRLTPNRVERMNHVRARLHAEHDIAADRRRRRVRAPMVERRRRKTLATRPTTAA